MKRIISLAISFILVLGTLCIAPLSAAAADEHILFEDDFSKEAIGWYLQGCKWGNDKVTLSTTGTQWAHLGDSEFQMFNPYTLEFDVKILGGVDDYSNDWVAINCGGSMIFFRVGLGTCHAYNGRSETGVGKAKLDTGVTYRIKAVIGANYTAMYYKEADAASYTDIGVYNNMSTFPSKLNIQCSTMSYEMDNVKIVSNGGNVVVDKKIKYLDLDTKDKIVLTGSGAAGCTFESDKPEYVSVDADGTLTAHKSGSAKIYVKDKNGKNVECVFTKVAIPPKTLSFNYDVEASAFVPKGSVQYDKKNIILGVGERCDLRTYFPSGTTLKGLNWSSQPADVVEVWNTSKNEETATITALKPGETVVTAASRFSDAKAEITIKVIPTEELDKTPQNTYTFYQTGKTQEISPMIMGAHLMGDYATKENTGKLMEQAGIQSGRTSNGFITDKMYDASKGETVADAMVVASNSSGKPMIFSLWSKMITGPENYDQNIKDITAFVKDLNEKYKAGPLYLELFNEMYSQSQNTLFPTHRDYMEFIKKLSPELRKVAPGVTLIACGYSPGEMYELVADPENLRTEDSGDPAYTQAGRIAYWDEAVRDELLAEGYVDAVAIHPYYPGGSHWNGMTGKNNIRSRLALLEENAMYRYYESVFYGLDTDFYYTESGNLEALIYWGPASGKSAEKLKYNYQKYPFAALTNAKFYLNVMRMGKAKVADLHAFIGVDGFNILESEDLERGYEVPNEIIFKKLSSASENGGKYYGVNALNMDYDTTFIPFRTTGKKNFVAIANVEAHGFGDENGIKEMAFFNQTDVPQKVKLEGATLKPNWSYGGSFDEIMPEWLKNESWDSWSQSTITYRNADVYTKPANKHEGAQFAEEIEIPPYTLMFADVNGTPAVHESTASKVCVSAENVFTDGVILNVGNSTAYVDNTKTVVDENPSVTPIVENDRTLLPLRFVAESLGCDVAYDDATQEITVKNKAVEVKLTLGQTAYTVNGEAKEFDVPAYEKDGRTLLPLRALAEALGKYVYWDDRGYIFVGRETLPFDKNTQFYFDEIAKLYN